MSNQMWVDVLRATRGDTQSFNGLITMRVSVPVYIWTEILTHKRLARNASSSRAQNAKRHVSMGHYRPPVFYADQAGMRVGDPLPEDIQEQATAIWERAWVEAAHYVTQLTALGVSREQANRLLPTTKMVNGILTGTEDAWERFLELRLSVSADTAMQSFAAQVAAAIENVSWYYRREHVPFGTDVRVAVAHIARVSYSGRSRSDDVELHDRLYADGHLSPFEHVARFVPESMAAPSALNSKPADVSLSGYAWQTYRAMLEEGDGW